MANNVSVFSIRIYGCIASLLNFIPNGLHYPRSIPLLKSEFSCQWKTVNGYLNSYL